MVKLYSTHCPKCIMLASKLRRDGIKFELVTDFNLEEIKAKGFSTMPLLEVDGEIMDFNEAIKWLSKRGK